MTLQDQLDAITARTRSLVQPERLAVSEQAAAELFSTGIEDRILPVGSRAPEFALEDSSSTNQRPRLVRALDLLTLGPLVIKFFRGRWDPYCVTELELWRDLYPELRSRGALFVAISPQTCRQNAFMVEQHRLPFPVLCDPGSLLAQQFRLSYLVPEVTRRYYRSILLNIPFANSGLTYETAPESVWHLPLPGLFLVDEAAILRFSQAFADPRVRPEPADVLALL